MKGLLIIQLIIALAFLGAIIFGVAKCSSYLTSGKVGRDIGEFAGEIRQGYDEKSSK